MTLAPRRAASSTFARAEPRLSWGTAPQGHLHQGYRQIVSRGFMRDEPTETSAILQRSFPGHVEHHEGPLKIRYKTG